MSPLRIQRRAWRAQGFTLIEIILVVLIFSIMAAMAYGGLNSVLKTRVAVEASMQRTAELQKAYMRLRGDFQNLVDRPARDNFGDLQPPLLGGKEQTVELTRGGWRNPLYLKRSSLQRVVYGLREHRLERASYRVLDRAQDSEPIRTVLLERVRELRWRYLNPDREWVDQWPPRSVDTTTSGEAAPPRAVELTIVTEDVGELRLLFKPGAEPPPANLNQPSPPGGANGSGNGNGTGNGNGLGEGQGNNDAASDS